MKTSMKALILSYCRIAASSSPAALSQGQNRFWDSVPTPANVFATHPKTEAQHLGDIPNSSFSLTLIFSPSPNLIFLILSYISWPPFQNCRHLSIRTVQLPVNWLPLQLFSAPLPRVLSKMDSWLHSKSLLISTP